MELPKAYDPKEAEEKWYAFWEAQHYFDGTVNPAKKPFAIVIPPPNVTGELHMGHALNNTRARLDRAWAGQAPTR
jgi:valyl-tRNA synthetase